MTAEEAICERLADIGPVTAIVHTRIYLDKIPQQGTYPLILVQLVDEPTDYHLRGGQRREARVQVDAYVQETGADPMGEVLALADAINGDDAGSGLSGWIGEIGGSPGFRVTGLFRIERSRGFEPDEVRLLRQRQDYRVHFQLA